MIRIGTSLIVVLAALAIAGCGSGGDNGSSSSSGSNTETVKLGTQNGSGESGTATLTAEGDQTKVVISLESMSANPVSQPQPAHIHTGSCANLDPTPKYGLTDVKDGKSTTTVNAKLDDLRNGAFAINVHKSAAAINTPSGSWSARPNRTRWPALSPSRSQSSRASRSRHAQL